MKVTANKGGHDSEKGQRGYTRRFGGRKGRKNGVIYYSLKNNRKGAGGDRNEVDSDSSTEVGYGGGESREPASTLLKELLRALRSNNEGGSMEGA